MLFLGVVCRGGLTRQSLADVAAEHSSDIDGTTWLGAVVGMLTLIMAVEVEQSLRPRVDGTKLPSEAVQRGSTASMGFISG